MKVNSKLAITLGVMFLASCSTEQPTPNTETVKNDGVLSTSNVRPEGANARTDGSISNGLAFGLPLSTGINYRVISISYVGSSQKFVRVEKDWFPSKKTNVDLPLSITYTNKTQSDVSVSANAGISISFLKSLISASISAVASKLESNSVTLEGTEKIVVPAMKQVRLSTFEQRKLYNAQLVRIDVIGSPLTAKESNGTLKVNYYRMTGSMPVQLFSSKEWR
jgi:hypothetical protein